MARAGWLSGGVMAVALALVIGRWDEVLFTAHMAEHMVLMDVAAPLLVLALRPGLSLPRWLVRPLPAALLHGIVLWGWHAPAIFQWALASDALRLLMHLSFLVAGLVFWASILGSEFGSGIFWSFMTLMHAGFLGALITFAPAPVYLCRAAAEPALADQQMAGLIMWIGAGSIYLVAGLALAAAWLRQLERLAEEG